MSERLPFRSPLRRLKTLPVLPTVLTSCNLACGVTAVMSAAQDRPYLGAVLIFVAMVFDMLDGKVARMTNTEGAFGAELDSLADTVSFGVAPAMLVHRLVLQEAGVFAPGERLIYVVTIFFCVMAAIRLARYNVGHDDARSTLTFSGLPSPGAAALVCSWVIFHGKYLVEVGEDVQRAINAGLMGMVVVCGLLMVSDIPFPHIGNTVLSDRLSFRRVMLIILALFLLAIYPVIVLALGTTAYVVAGFLAGLVTAVRRWRAGHSLLDDDDEEPGEEDGETAARRSQGA